MKNLFFRQKGMTIVELMVAVLIGLLSMYAVYRVYEGTERTKRNITSVGGAQIAGLYSVFVLEKSIQGAGSTMMTPLDVNGTPGNGPLLANCINDVGNNTWGTVTGGGMASPATFSLRPIPVLIVPNRVDFDDIFVFSGNSTFHLDPVDVAGVNVAGGVQTTTITTPFGFKDGDVLVDTLTGTGAPNAACQAYLVPRNSTDPNGNSPANIATGTVALNLQGVGGPAVNNRLVDLGNPIRRHFYVDNANTLLMEEWTLNAGGTWNRARIDPIISGVISLRALYGIGPVTVNIDSRSNNVIGPVGQWVLGDNLPWDAASILASPLQAPPPANTIRQIKAVWLSIIVQVDEPELDNDVAATLPTNFIQFAVCPQGTTCPTPSPVVPLPEGRRYRMYESVIPLINVIWN